MPIVIAATVDEALIRSSAGRHEAAWMAGVAGGLRKGVGALVVEVDVTSRGESSGLLELHTVQGRLSLLGEAHLGDAEDRFRFVVGAGPAATLASTEVAGITVLHSLQGGRAVLGLDLVLRGAHPGVEPAPPERWTVGLRVGTFGHREGVDADLGVRTGWTF